LIPTLAAAPALGLFPPIRKSAVDVLQFNIGRLCNQACRHCHVDSSPDRTGPEDNAPAEVVDGVLELLRRSPGLSTLDVTGGAPELNPHFRRLVAETRRLGRTVLVRHNLTVQFEPGQEDLPEFFAEQGVELFCSLPCYLEENVNAQRGRGVYAKSIEALRRLNAAGFGRPGGGLRLHLVYNPLGPTLPPPQDALEASYKHELRTRFGIEFDRLAAIANQPIHRFREDLARHGRLDGYMNLLRENFNVATLPGLMCRNSVSVRWDGRLYDCDFNLVQDLPLRGPDGREWLLTDLLAAGAGALAALPIATDQHCFACTAGCGSSCGGALVA
jgi:radical SAM/Cys-rich protein